MDRLYESLLLPQKEILLLKPESDNRKEDFSFKVS